MKWTVCVPQILREALIPSAVAFGDGVLGGNRLDEVMMMEPSVMGLMSL